MPKTYTDPAPLQLTPDRGPLFKVYEAAEYLTVNARTIERLIEAGALPSVKIGRARRIFKADLDAYLDGLAA